MSAAPVELLDPDGEGIYILSDSIPSPLLRAAQIFHGTMAAWPEVEQRTVFMRPKKNSDEWERVPRGLPAYWRLNLPRRWFPWATYAYLTPRPTSTQTALPPPASSPKNLSREGTK